MLHDGMTVKAHQRHTLECLPLTARGKIPYELKIPLLPHMIFELLVPRQYNLDGVLDFTALVYLGE